MKPERSQIGGYRLVREIGRGAMAVVYEATQPRLRRSVAVKVLHGAFAGEPKVVRRFLREAEAGARLQHPNVVAVHDRGQDDGLPFIVMELVEGPTLGEVIALARGETGSDERLAPLPGPDAPVADRVALALEIGAEVGDALEHAHDRGVVHRDVKPGNILLQGRRPQIADFGLADVLWGSTLTATGERLGTPAYMSPEQARGDEADARSDVYSLGATLYEFVTLRRPIEGGSIQDYFRRIPQEDPPPARKLEPGVPRDLEVLLAKALEKDPAHRYASAAAMAADLRRVAAGEPIEARPPGVVRRVLTAARRRPRITLLACSLLLALAATAIVSAVWPEGPPPTRLRVETLDGRQVPVEIVPADEIGHARWAERRRLGTTGESLDVEPGEVWILVGTREAFAEVTTTIVENEETVIRTRVVPRAAAAEGMVLVPGGTVEVPKFPGMAKAGPVTHRALHLDETEVSRAEFARFLASTSHPPPSLWSRKSHEGDYGDLPVSGLSWYDAQAYATWAGKRLPTRDEWLAAFFRDGPPTEGQVNVRPRRARPVLDAGPDRTALGLMHLLGNVSEWTQTWHLERQRDAEGNEGLLPTKRYVLGKSYDLDTFSDSPVDVLVFDPSHVRSSRCGFRCARSAGPWSGR